MTQMNLNNSNDTICAPATIPGTGAISIIRVSGKDTFSIADKILKTNGLPISKSDGYRIRYCTVYADNGVLDNVLVSVFRAPHSYTGEDSIEISCHASKYIVSELMRLLVKAGARVAGPGEFTQRAFLNGKMDLAQAEAVADVIASQSEASHRVAMNQLKGGYSNELKSLREELLKMTSLLELELDFSEEDVEFANREQLKALVDGTLSHITTLADSFKLGNAIKNGIPVAIAGATNTGKSTLLNAILGDDRAIVSDIAGTTRDTIEETFNIDGTLFRFIDTAGIRETSEEIEKIGIVRTFKKLDEADIVLGMTDISRGVESVVADAEFIYEKAGSSKHLILLVNKCDNLSEDKHCLISDGTDNSNDAQSRLVNGDGISVYVGNTSSNDPENSTDEHRSEDDLKAGDSSNKPENSTDEHRPNNNETMALNLSKAPAIDSSSEQGQSSELAENLPEAAVNKNVIIFNKIVSQIKNKHIDCTIVPISAKRGLGISTLKKCLSNIGKDLTGGSDSTLVTNIRHYEALENAATSLGRVRSGLESSLPADLVAQDLREALYHLGSILGEITTDEVLGNIFKNFCIGK